MRRHVPHQVSNELVKTHDRLVIENPNVSGMLANHRLARAISDAGWTEFARLLGYKLSWHSRTLLVADRWFPSCQIRSTCGERNTALTLADRIYTWPAGPRPIKKPHQIPGPPGNGAGPPTPAGRTALTSTLRVPVKPARKDVGTDAQAPAA